MRELIVDSFAGGGGASTGIEMALGRSPDIAVNHDATALAMHEVNHPSTVHVTEDVWKVDPMAATGGRPVGLAWFSPDCKHFSKAKGGKPVSKNIRSLAWVVVHWANTVAPRVIILENVEEFQTWGPLAADGRPCPLQKGVTFKRWIAELERLGYAVEWRELRACDYGAPTIRKRLFLIARRDGRPIAWPEPTHGDPKSDAVRQGLLKPWRTAAEIIDWSLPCPSIFDSSEEIMAKFGLRAVRPLQPATMARIAKGVKRYVLDAAKPFIVRTDMASGSPRNGVHTSEEPVRTMTSAQSFAVVTPHLANLTHQGGDRVESLQDPLMTVTGAHRGEKAIVTPFVTGVGGRMGQTEPRGADRPAQTLTAKADSVLVAPFAVPRYGERDGQEPRTVSLETPMPVVVPTGNGASLVAPYLARTAHGDVGKDGKRRGQGVHPLDEPHGTVLASNDHALVAPVITFAQQGGGIRDAGEPLHTVTASAKDQNQVIAPHLTKFHGGQVGASIEDPAPTVTSNSYLKRPGGAAPIGVVAPHLMTMRNAAKPFNEADKPAHTVTSGGAHMHLVAAHLAQNNIDGHTGEGKPGRPVDAPLSTVLQSGSHASLVAAFMAQHNYLEPGHDAREPVSTIVGKGSTQGLVAANLLRQFGTGVGSAVDEPTRTVMADGQGKTQLSAAFLQKYYGVDQDPKLEEPLHTATTKDRFGLVTVDVDGVTYVITDIGMRMLTPRELFRAQGFPESYVIDRRPDGSPISKTDQVSKCGNSVCPPIAAALVKANFAPEEIEPAPRFMEAAE